MKFSISKKKTTRFKIELCLQSQETQGMVQCYISALFIVTSSTYVVSCSERFFSLVKRSNTSWEGSHSLSALSTSSEFQNNSNINTDLPTILAKYSGDGAD